MTERGLPSVVSHSFAGNVYNGLPVRLPGYGLRKACVLVIPARRFSSPPPGGEGLGVGGRPFRLAEYPLITDSLPSPASSGRVFSNPCRLRAPHPLPLPTRGRGAEAHCHHAGAFFLRASNVNTATFMETTTEQEPCQMKRPGTVKLRAFLFHTPERGYFQL